MKKDGKKKGDSGKLLKRVFQYVGKNYKYHLIFVLIGIFVSVLANVQGTMFMKTMIDLPFVLVVAYLCFGRR